MTEAEAVAATVPGATWSLRSPGPGLLKFATVSLPSTTRPPDAWAVLFLLRTHGWFPQSIDWRYDELDGLRVYRLEVMREHR